MQVTDLKEWLNLVSVSSFPTKMHVDVYVIPIKGTVSPLYTKTRYNYKIRCSDASAGGMNPSLKT